MLLFSNGIIHTVDSACQTPSRCWSATMAASPLLARCAGTSGRASCRPGWSSSKPIWWATWPMNGRDVGMVAEGCACGCDQISTDGRLAAAYKE
jgi:hypothetical protein